MDCSKQAVSHPRYGGAIKQSDRTSTKCLVYQMQPWLDETFRGPTTTAVFCFIKQQLANYLGDDVVRYGNLWDELLFHAIWQVR
jgi:hypothetical protein